MLVALVSVATVATMRCCWESVGNPVVMVVVMAVSVLMYGRSPGATAGFGVFCLEGDRKPSNSPAAFALPWDVAVVPCTAKGMASESR